MSVDVPGAPAAVSAALDDLATALPAAAGADFAGLVLYGGLARGRFREGRSDVNVVVLLRRADAGVLDRIAPALRAARRSAGVETMLLTPQEVPAAAHDFPTKFLDIRRHHLLLAGEDPFATLQVPRALVQRRIAQSLRNLLLRLRRRYAIAFDDAAELKTTLADLARPLAIELAALLADGGHAVPEADRTAAIYAAAAQAFGLDAGALADVAALRDGTWQDRRPVAQVCGALLAVLAALADRTDALAGAGS
jgi:hypothetical protein